MWMRSKIVIQGSDFLNHSTHSQHSTTNKNHIYSHYFDHHGQREITENSTRQILNVIYSNCKIYQYNTCSTAKGEMLLEMAAAYL